MNNSQNISLPNGKLITNKKAFTLVELLIVIIILGMLSAIIVPKFSNASVEARESMLRENIRILRNQIATYRAQHWETAPGYDAGGNISEQTFIDQMTMFTDEHGNTNDIGGAAFPYGPYLLEIPENPINARADMNLIMDDAAMPAQATDNTGWIFKPQEIIFRANSIGSDFNGTEYYSY